jgi:hypothetical protein
MDLFIVAAWEVWKIINAKKMYAQRLRLPSGARTNFHNSIHGYLPHDSLFLYI